MTGSQVRILFAAPELKGASGGLCAAAQFTDQIPAEEKNWAATMRPKSREETPRAHYEHITSQSSKRAAISWSGDESIPLHDVTIFLIVSNGRSAASARTAAPYVPTAPALPQLSCRESNRGGSTCGNPSLRG